MGNGGRIKKLNFENPFFGSDVLLPHMFRQIYFSAGDCIKGPTQRERERESLAFRRIDKLKSKISLLAKQK
jgi:hypothetical protein